MVQMLLHSVAYIKGTLLKTQACSDLTAFAYACSRQSCTGCAFSAFRAS